MSGFVLQLSLILSNSRLNQVGNIDLRTQIQREILYCHLRNRTNPQSHHGNQRKEKKTKEQLLLYIVYSGFIFQIVEFVSVYMLPSCPHALVFLPCICSFL